eukprot:scaffold257137_cov47-Prasinocladus_malaysianus.AAC.1
MRTLRRKSLVFVSSDAQRDTSTARSCLNAPKTNNNVPLGSGKKTVIRRPAPWGCGPGLRPRVGQASPAQDGPQQVHLFA